MIKEGLEPEKPKEFKKRRRISPWVSVVFLLLISLLYTFPLDITYALWVWPAFVFAIPGLIISLFAKSWKAFLIAGWVLFGFAHVTEVRSFFRLGSYVQIPLSRKIRIASLNCAGGSLEAAKESSLMRADLVLLQESPSVEDLGTVRIGTQGTLPHVVPGPDASILAVGSLEQVPMPRGTSNFVAAKWSYFPGKVPYNVVSLRLTPPVMRIDLFDPSAWQEFAKNRQMRRQEVLEIAQKLKEANFKPDIIGGDFNTPPDPDVLKPLTEEMTDVFASVGRGYGATCVHPYPCMVRIDHLYISNRLIPFDSFVVKTKNSDHRMLFGELDPAP